LLRKATQQSQLALAEVLLLDEGSEAARTTVHMERCDGVATPRDGRHPSDLRFVVLGLCDVRVAVDVQGRDRQRPRSKLRGDLRGVPVLALQRQLAVRLEVEGRVAAAEDLRRQ